MREILMGNPEFMSAIQLLMNYSAAEAIAKIAHNGQFRRDGVTPYVTHPIAVASMVSDEAKPVAVLHDVLEDSDRFKERDLRLVLSAEIVDAVVILTKKFGDVYEDYIERVKANPLAREVKIADITHNLSSNPKEKNVEKYRKALDYLNR